VDRHHAKPSIERAGVPADPRAFGLTKAAYSVNETLELLSIGRTSLYAAIKQGDLHPTKFGRKTLLYASDLAAFLAKLSEANALNASATARRGRERRDQSC
jgi:excisionase family DNA binding protein